MSGLSARLINLPRRSRTAGKHLLTTASSIVRWLFKENEINNFTYHLSEKNKLYLAFFVAEVTSSTVQDALGLINELDHDHTFHTGIVARTSASTHRSVSSPESRLGRRLGWYAIARLCRPRLIVETGVDKGLGAAALCTALLRNAAEGHPGRYVGIDINPDAGWLLDQQMRAVGTIICSDSLLALRSDSTKIDLLISDSDHSLSYETEEYRVAAERLSSKGIILSDNSHVTAALADFSLGHGRRFLFFKEEPRHHWYPGGGIGASFPGSVPAG